MLTIESIRSHCRQREPQRSGRMVGVAAGAAADPDAVRRLFDEVQGPIEEVVVAGGERDALAPIEVRVEAM